MATNTEILSAVYDSYFESLTKAPNKTKTVTYKDFKKCLLESGIYVSDPSIRNAWLRIGKHYTIIRESPGTREHPELRSYTFDVMMLTEFLGEMAYTPGKAREKKEMTEEVY